MGINIFEGKGSQPQVAQVAVSSTVAWIILTATSSPGVSVHPQNACIHVYPRLMSVITGNILRPHIQTMALRLSPCSVSGTYTLFPIADLPILDQ